MTTIKREQKILFFSGGTPEGEDTLESRFPYPGLIGKKGPWLSAPNFSVADATLLGGTPGDLEIQLVRVDSAAPTIPNQFDLAWWSDEANAKVTTESGTSTGRVAGVFMATLAAVVGGNKVTYIAKQGLYPTKFIASPTVAPDNLGKAAVPSTTDAQANCITAAAETEIFGRTAGAQVNSALNRLDDTALVSLKIVD